MEKIVFNFVWKILILIIASVILNNATLLNARDIPEGMDKFIIYIVNPTSKNKVLIDTLPVDAHEGNEISIKACRGEFEPASFVVKALFDLSNIDVVITDLTGSDGSAILSKYVDVKIVKCWYQSGYKSINNSHKRFLVPELLLNDDTLLLVDERNKKNYLKVKIDGKTRYFDVSSLDSSFPVNGMIYDADKFQPFSMKANTYKQIWLTIKIPLGQKSGLYSGKILLYISGVKIREIFYHVQVLPFDLEPSALEYGLYYRARLRSGNLNEIGSDNKDERQYAIELIDMQKHGIMYPTLYQQYDSLLGKTLDLRERNGFSLDKIYTLGTNTGSSNDTRALDNLFKRVSKWLSFVKGKGCRELFIYAPDEAKGDKLFSERTAWRTTHSAGAKVFAACSIGAADLVGDVLDVAVTSARGNAGEINKFKSYGAAVLSYANPQVGIENPYIYRCNYGFLLWCLGYDGCMDYAYQHAFGHIWNDFDH